MRKCEVCCESDAKYQCPRCEIRTCCLGCVKQHKVNTDCDGQRDKTAFVKLSEFSDRNLLNDYRFLEDTGRKNNNAGRDILKRKHNRPNFLRELEKQAGIRNINLRLMPYPMSRRKNNSTCYQNRLKKMYWQIEWVFADVDLTLTDKKICEDDMLDSVLERHMSVDADPLLRHKLKPYITAGKENWSLFMKYDNSVADKPLFYKLEATQSLLENFRYKQILEYPSIYVVLPSKSTQYNTVPLEEMRTPSLQEKLTPEGEKKSADTEKATQESEKLSAHSEKLTPEDDNNLDTVTETAPDKGIISNDILKKPVENVT